MKNFIIGVLCGVAVGFLIFKLAVNKGPKFAPEGVNQKISIFGGKGILPKELGKEYIANYMRSGLKPFGETQFFYIDSTGFKELVNDSAFFGLYIYPGIKDTLNPNSIQLLFTGVKQIIGSRKDTTYEPYFVKNSTDEYYLDKINPCPGSPGCPTK
jgi:hypothetical protein